MMWEEYYFVLRQLPDWIKNSVPFIVEALSLFKEYGARVFLDLGCGVGRNSIYLSEEGLMLLKSTFRSALKKAKVWAKIKGIPSVTALRASMTKLPFVRQTFHTVISVSVIHHAAKEDTKKAIEEIQEVLKDNGLF